MSIQQLNSEPPEPTVSSDTDSVTCYTPSASSVDENDLSQTYSSYDFYWSSIYSCPCCSPLYLDDRIADAQAASSFPSSHYTISEYSDFRASSRAQQRARKIRENKSGCNSYRCRKMEQAQQDTRNLKKKIEGLKWAVRESQKEVPCYMASFGRRTRHCFVEWDTRLEEEMDGCFCRESKCAPVPEERQRCNLVQWVGQEGREIIRMEEAREEKARLHDSDDDVGLSKPEMDCGWDIISIASSKTWSVVDADVV